MNFLFNLFYFFIVALHFLECKWTNGHLLQSAPEMIEVEPAEEGDNFRSIQEDQTPIEIDERVLKMFGFNKRPKSGRDMHIPKLMQHLYKAHMGDNFDGQKSLMEGWENGFDLPQPHVTSVVNTARSFHHIESDEHLDGTEHHQIRLRFDLSTLPDHEVVHASELLLHREGIANHFLEEGKHLHRINVYEIIKILNSSKTQGSSKLDRFFGARPVTRLLDTRLVDVRNSTWERFDVSQATTKWARNHHHDNHGVLIEVVQDGSGSLDKEFSKHVRIKRSLHPDLNSRSWRDRRPTLLTYTSDGQDTNLHRRTRRSSNPGSRKRDTANSSRKKRRRKKKHRPCARHSLYVDFSDVGWNDWIVAPHGYDAFYCQGQCLFPLAEHLNATNHAIVQTLANSVNAMLVPRTCCVPTQLSSISMLYVDKHDLVVLKSYPSMVVDACGCR